MQLERSRNDFALLTRWPLHAVRHSHEDQTVCLTGALLKLLSGISVCPQRTCGLGMVHGASLQPSCFSINIRQKMFSKTSSIQSVCEMLVIKCDLFRYEHMYRKAITLSLYLSVSAAEFRQLLQKWSFPHRVNVYLWNSGFSSCKHNIN